MVWLHRVRPSGMVNLSQTWSSLATWGCGCNRTTSGSCSTLRSLHAVIPLWVWKTLMNFSSPPATLGCATCVALDLFVRSLSSSICSILAMASCVFRSGATAWIQRRHFCTVSVFHFIRSRFPVSSFASQRSRYASFFLTLRCSPGAPDTGVGWPGR